ncbi:unnamed protein product [Anisakis simplex]|uniref:Uncharacterized sugar kinase (inferred by orthology to a C. elegans protein) n=1 Tax=Anisakis simplex TaxID=6269 RepID=A0A0M3JCW7_ANISI|nr:unnamed protein product [Anisakis simplex]
MCCDVQRISLVSSFIASVLCGHIVGIDAGDACGMNLMDVRNGVWSEKCLNVLAETDEQKVLLKKKLGEIVPCESIVVCRLAYFSMLRTISKISILHF